MGAALIGTGNLTKHSQQSQPPLWPHPVVFVTAVCVQSRRQHLLARYRSFQGVCHRFCFMGAPLGYTQAAAPHTLLPCKQWPVAAFCVCSKCGRHKHVFLYYTVGVVHTHVLALMAGAAALRLNAGSSQVSHCSHSSSGLLTAAYVRSTRQHSWARTATVL